MKQHVMAGQIKVAAPKKFVTEPKKTVSVPGLPQAVKPKERLPKPEKPALEKPIEKAKKPYRSPAIKTQPSAPTPEETKSPAKKDMFDAEDFLDEPETKEITFQSLPDVDIDISSPGQSALTMVMLVDNMVDGAQTFMENFKSFSDVQIQDNPDQVKKGLTHLVESLNDRVYMLRSVFDEFANQVSS